MKIATDGFAGRFRPNPVVRERHLVLPEEAVVYAVGDVHGCRTELLDLEQRIAADAAATSRRRYIVMLGDYVDFGPDSAGVLDHLMAPPPDGFERICLKGNHESFFESFLEKPAGELEWLRLGGAETLASYGVEVEDPHSRRGRRLLAREVDQLVPRQHRDFLKRLSFTARIGDVLLVHAGLRPGVPLEAQKPDDMMLIREEFLADEGDPGFLVVHGHTVTARPDIARTRIGIDTGAYRTGRLTALKIAPEGLSLLSNQDEAPDPLPASLFAHGPGTISTVRAVAAPPVRPVLPQSNPPRRGPVRILRYGAVATVLAAAAAFAAPGFLGGPAVEDTAGTPGSEDAVATGSVKRVTVELADGPVPVPASDEAVPSPPQRPDVEPRTELAALTPDEIPDAAIVDELPMVDVPLPAVLPPERISFRPVESQERNEPAPWGKALLGTGDLRREVSEPSAGDTEPPARSVETAALGPVGEEAPVATDLTIIPLPKARPDRPDGEPEVVRPRAEERSAKRRPAEPLRRSAQPLPGMDLTPPPPLDFDPPPARRHFVDVRVCDGWLFGSCRMVRLPVQGIGPDGAVILRGPIADTAPARRQGRTRPVTRNGTGDFTRGSREAGRIGPGGSVPGTQGGGVTSDGSASAGEEGDGAADAGGGTGPSGTGSGGSGGEVSSEPAGGGTGGSSAEGKGSSGAASGGKGSSDAASGGKGNSGGAGSSGGRDGNAASSKGSGKGGGKGSKG